MFVLLDSKDLIDLIDHSTPVSAEDAGSLFRQRGWKFVLSTTNVTEYAASVLKTGDKLAVRHGLQRIEALPSTYIRNGWIEQHEMETAYRAFVERVEPAAVDPFVNRWDETIVRSGRPKKSAMLVNYRLDENGLES